MSGKRPRTPLAFNTFTPPPPIPSYKLRNLPPGFPSNMAMGVPQPNASSQENHLRKLEEIVRQGNNNRGSGNVNNLTQRVRKSIRMRNGNRRVTISNGQPLSPNNKNTRTGYYTNKTTRTKVKTIANYVPNNTNTKAIKEQKYRKAVPRLPLQLRGRMRMSENQTRTFTDIFTSSEDFGEMLEKINSLNRDPSYKNALRSYLMYIAQETLPSNMEYQPPNVNYTEADPNFPGEKLNAKP